ATPDAVAVVGPAPGTSLTDGELAARGRRRARPRGGGGGGGVRRGGGRPAPAPGGGPAGRPPASACPEVCFLR
ncbi:hypothetical protein, partial [Nocardia asiatica]|uniref:hypothetical protein n=1 Tax=Nocardia asiatica TaxID=209252 RepID=UPI002453A93E